MDELDLEQKEDQEILVRKKNKSTLLLAAAKSGKKEMLEYLIKKGMDPALQRNDGVSIVDRALISENLDCIQYAAIQFYGEDRLAEVLAKAKELAVYEKTAKNAANLLLAFVYPESPILLEAFKRYQALLASHPKLLVKIEKNQSVKLAKRALLQERDFRLAIVYSSQGLYLSRNNLGLQLIQTKALCELDKKNMEALIFTRLDGILKTNPHHVDTVFYTGFMYEKKGCYIAALAYYEQALAYENANYIQVARERMFQPVMKKLFEEVKKGELIKVKSEIDAKLKIIAKLNPQNTVKLHMNKLNLDGTYGGDLLLHAAARSGSLSLLKYLIDECHLDAKKLNANNENIMIVAMPVCNAEMLHYLASVSFGCDYLITLAVHYSGKIAIAQKLFLAAMLEKSTLRKAIEHYATFLAKNARLISKSEKTLIESRNFALKEKRFFDALKSCVEIKALNSKALDNEVYLICCLHNLNPNAQMSLALYQKLLQDNPQSSLILAAKNGLLLQQQAKYHQAIIFNQQVIRLIAWNEPFQNAIQEMQEYISKRTQQLFYAVEAGNLTSVKEILEGAEGSEYLKKQYNDLPLLHAAARSRSLPLLKYLIKQRYLSIDITFGSQEISVLEQAASESTDLELLRYLAQKMGGLQNLLTAAESARQHGEPTKAKQLLKAGMYEESAILLDACDAYQELMAASFRVHNTAQEIYNHATQLCREDKFLESLFFTLEGLSAYSNNNDLLIRRATCLHKLKDDASASIKRYNELIEMNPNKAIPILNRAILLREKSRTEEAFSDLETLMCRIDSLEAFVQNSLRSEYEGLVVLYPEKLFDYALKSLESDPAKSLEMNGILLEKHPNYSAAAVYNNRGCALQKLKRYTEAATSYHNSLQRDRNYTLALNNLKIIASTLYDEKMYRSALETYEIIYRYIPSEENAQNYKRRGECYEGLGNKEKAFDCHREAFRLAPNNWSVRCALYQLAKKEFDSVCPMWEAMWSYDEIIKNEPKNGWLYVEKGDALLKRNCRSEAIKFYLKAFNIDVNTYNYALDRIINIADKLSGNEAIGVHQQVLNVNPNQSRALNNQAVLYQNMGDLAKAKQLYKKAMDLGNAQARQNYNNVIATEEAARRARERELERRREEAAAQYERDRAAEAAEKAAEEAQKEKEKREKRIKKMYEQEDWAGLYGEGAISRGELYNAIMQQGGDSEGGGANLVGIRMNLYSSIVNRR